MKKIKWIVDLFKKEFKDSPLQSCTLNICYYNNDDSFNIFLTNINNSDLAIRQVALVSMLETAKLEEVPELTASQSLLIYANLKIHEMNELSNFVDRFEYSYSISGGRINTPIPTWWQEFKFYVFGIDYYSNKVTNYKYIKKRSDAN